MKALVQPNLMDETERIRREMEKVEVVAALIWREGRFLICQRPMGKRLEGLWEFVGGKVEVGEQREQALVRECREELGITVKVGKLFFEVEHRYPFGRVQLFLYEASVVEGEPQNLEHRDIRWIRVDEIDQYDFCPADGEILEKLKREYGK